MSEHHKIQKIKNMINKHIPWSCSSPQKTQSLVFIYSFKPYLEFAKQNFLLLCLLSNFVKMESYWIHSSVIFSSTPSQTFCFWDSFAGTQAAEVHLPSLLCRTASSAYYCVHCTRHITQYTARVTQCICVLLWMDPCVSSRFLWLLFFCCEQCLSIPAEGNGNPLQYSCLENPMGGGAW